MKPSPALFELIKSLSKSEKRYFKLNSTLQTGSKNYIKLFDAIEKQKEYDEEEIKEKFKKETFIKHLPSEKNHLFNIILKSLRGYHSDRSAAAILHELLRNMELLYDKTMFKECIKLVRKAKSIAYTYEKFYYLLDIINWEKRLMEEEYLRGNFETDVADLIKEEQACIEKLNNIAEYHLLFSKINHASRKEGIFARNKNEKQIFDEVMNHPLIKGKNTAKSIKATATCYLIQGMGYIGNNDHAGALSKFEKVVEVFETHPEIIEEVPKRYLRAVASLCFCYMETKQKEKLEANLKKLRNLANHKAFYSRDLQVKSFIFTLNAELVVFEALGDEKRLLNSVNSSLERYEDLESSFSLEEKSLLNYNFAYAYFGAGEHKKALKWLNEVINESEGELRQDIYSFARIFSIIIHFEMKHYDLMDYIIKSSSRYIKKKERIYKVEEVFFSYIKKLAKQRVAAKQKEIFKKFKVDIDKALQEPYEKVALKYFDFVSWIDSKIEGKPYLEAKKEKYAGN